jgi:hypothetical protein
MRKIIVGFCLLILPVSSFAFDFRTESQFSIHGAWDMTDPIEKQFVFDKKFVPIPEAPADRALVVFFKAPLWMYSPAIPAPRRICNRIYTEDDDKIGAVVEGSYFLGTVSPDKYLLKTTGEPRTDRGGEKWGGGSPGKRWLYGRFTFEAGKTYFIECTYFGPPLRLVDPDNFLYHIEGMKHIKEVLATPPASIPKSDW